MRAKKKKGEEKKIEIPAVQKGANLVELEKCCQTHIFLQKFVLVQPRTSPPKISKILVIIFLILLTLTCPSSVRSSVVQAPVRSVASVLATSVMEPGEQAAGSVRIISSASSNTLSQAVARRRAT